MLVRVRKYIKVTPDFINGPDNMVAFYETGRFPIRAFEAMSICMLHGTVAVTNVKLRYREMIKILLYLNVRPILNGKKEKKH